MQLAYCNSQGELLEDPSLLPLGVSGDELWELTEEDLIPMPSGTTISAMPGRIAIGLTESGEVRELEGWAVAALLPLGYLRLLAPAGIPVDDEELPLFGYTAVCFHQGELKVAAKMVDQDHRWAPHNYNLPHLENLVAAKRAQYPHNQIIEQLAHCAVTYNCFTAQNIFYGRWEGGIPVSGKCNAACRGCISWQSSECCPSPQGRINYTPSCQEIVEVALPHLMEGADPIISGGQGCEGDPLLASELWAEAITTIRKETNRGMININTNGGNTRGLKEVVASGLDGVRVGLISTNPKLYEAYHRPQYDFSRVAASLSLAKEAGVHTALNLLTFPGITDREGELESLVAFVRELGVEMVQLRNLNLDPETMKEFLPFVEGEALGMAEFYRQLNKACPELSLGGYTHSTG